MEYKMEYLEELIAVSIKTNQGNHFNLSSQDITPILSEIAEEIQRLKCQLIRDVFQFSNQKKIEAYIKNQQLACTHLLDRLFFEQQSLINKAEGALTFYNSLNSSMISILTFIEERFSRYFDKHEKVPDAYLVIVRKEISGKLHILAPKLAELNEPIITEKLLKRIETFLAENQEGKITYAELLFFKELIKELEDIPQAEKAGSPYSALQLVLISMNYNAREFINDQLNRISSEIDRIEDINDKMDSLLLYSKILNQQHFRPDTGLLPRYPSVKAQLSTWLGEELSYLESKLNGTPKARLAGLEEKLTKQKLTCQLSVDQLGILFRAASDLKLIKCNSQKALFEQIAPALATPHKQQLSADSMRSKSYSPEKKDLEQVKDILMQLFRQVGRF